MKLNFYRPVNRWIHLELKNYQGYYVFYEQRRTWRKFGFRGRSDGLLYGLAFKRLNCPCSIFLLLGEVEPGNGFTLKHQIRMLQCAVKPCHYQIQHEIYFHIKASRFENLFLPLPPGFLARYAHSTALTFFSIQSP